MKTIEKILRGLLVIVSFPIITSCGGYSEKTDVLMRSTQLLHIHKMVAEYEETTKEPPDLYKVFHWSIYTKHNPLNPALLKIKQRNPIDMSKSNVFMDSTSEFYDYSDYQIIYDKNGWWAIVELKYGVYEGFFLMITRDKKYVRFTEPFLPKQIDFLNKLKQ